MSFTPGPWMVHPEFPADIQLSDETQIATAMADGFQKESWKIRDLPMPTDEVMRANAHLIAAAPDLYAALKSFVDFYEPVEGWKSARMSARVHQAKAALAKAEGNGQ